MAGRIARLAAIRLARGMLDEPRRISARPDPHDGTPCHPLRRGPRRHSQRSPPRVLRAPQPDRTRDSRAREPGRPLAFVMERGRARDRTRHAWATIDQCGQPRCRRTSCGTTHSRRSGELQRSAIRKVAKPSPCSTHEPAASATHCTGTVTQSRQRMRTGSLRFCQVFAEAHRSAVSTLLVTRELTSPCGVFARPAHRAVTFSHSLFCGASGTRRHSPPQRDARGHSPSCDGSHPGRDALSNSPAARCGPNSLGRVHECRDEPAKHASTAVFTDARRIQTTS